MVKGDASDGAICTVTDNGEDDYSRMEKLK